MPAPGLNPFWFILACLIFITGVIFILDPNFEGVYGYTESHTLGRLLGWLAAMGSLTLLLLQSNLLGGRQEKTRFLDVTIIGLGLLAIGSGLVGAILGVTPGLFNSLDIQDQAMRLLEGVYVIAGIGLLAVYRIKRTALLHFLFDDLPDE